MDFSSAWRCLQASSWWFRAPATGECQGAGALAGLAAASAPFIGWGIDDEISTPVYERSAQRTAVTVTPLIGSQRLALMARVWF
jgi:hypothetical protein